jgi:hypothetical protein
MNDLLPTVAELDIAFIDPEMRHLIQSRIAELSEDCRTYSRIFVSV